MRDTIYRDDAIRVASGFCHPANVAEELEKLPSAEPERETGWWIPMKVSSGRDSWKCSVCGRRARGKLENLPYCHCGAKMEVEHETD